MAETRDPKDFKDDPKEIQRLAQIEKNVALAYLRANPTA